MSQLDAALAALDGSTAPRPSTVEGCRLCYTDEELADLTGSRDTVPDEVVAQVAREVPDHWGDFPGLYRWLAPRIMRVTVTRPELATFEGQIAARFVAAGWTSWPERAALTEVFRAWWLATLSTSEPKPPVADVLDFLVSATGEITPWLRQWPDTAAAHLAELVTWAAPALVERRPLFGDWLDERPDVDGDLASWLLDDARARVTDEDAVWYLDMLAEEW